jgi:glycosyltransferase involved in cell wall biosynthesis
LRIAHYVSHFPDPGGTTTAMLGLSAGLVRLGHHVVVYGDRPRRSPAEWEPVLNRAAAAGIEVPDSHPGNAPSPREKRRQVLAALASDRDRLDALVIHSVFGTSHPAVGRAARQGGITLLACPHDPYTPELFRERRVLKTVYWYLREAPFLRRMRAIHVLAPSHTQYLRDRRIGVPVFAIPDGLDEVQIEPFDDPIAEGPDPDAVAPGIDSELRLFYFGRWDVYNKGLDILLEAIAAEGSVPSSVTLQIAGNGSHRDRRRLERLIASHGLEARASVVGFLPDVRSAVRSADFVILPSRFDGFAQSVTEALALGTPVIVSNRAGSSEYFGREDGALVTEPDVASLVRTLRVAIGSRRALREAASAGRARLAREFNWDEVARRWIEEAQRVGALPARSER